MCLRPGWLAINRRVATAAPGPLFSAVERRGDIAKQFVAFQCFAFRNDPLNEAQLDDNLFAGCGGRIAHQHQIGPSLFAQGRAAGAVPVDFLDTHGNG